MNPKSTRQNLHVSTNINPIWLQTSNKLPKNGSSNSTSLDTISLHKPAITTPPPKLPLLLLLLKPLRRPPLPSSTSADHVSPFPFHPRRPSVSLILVPAVALPPNQDRLSLPRILTRPASQVLQHLSPNFRTKYRSSLLFFFGCLFSSGLLCGMKESTRQGLTI
ncbi:uncharacterized protein LOC103955269 [Pyrus x bretschneideri]|uniref:uncharacterized protein LOC103955269 n=1 Tax=Pyrus x bretschneideri TaxID=225117 RepID=UPI002030B9C4|nr:uncharacterized protein LOC103955269 [Pyrus x bretschneideri]